MFTGLVETLGTVIDLEPIAAGQRLRVTAPIVAELQLGESVAINGVCLTVVASTAADCTFEIGPETLLKTNLGDLRPGDRVNLERSLRVGDRLGGHWVQGHVDGTGFIVSRSPDGEFETIWFECSIELTRQMVPKGSIAVDGISLTLVNVGPTRFSVMLIPHTLTVTTLGFKQPGAAVNLETDILAKYVQKLVVPETYR
jgi:riboflavin synthase